MNLPQRSGDGALEGRVSRGLVLMGGGARTAYQAGALQALAGLLAQGPAKTDQKFPFEVLIGTSAGALNATYLASRAADGLAAMQGLIASWPLIWAAPNRFFTCQIPRWRHLAAGPRRWD